MLSFPCFLSHPVYFHLVTALGSRFPFLRRGIPAVILGAPVLALTNGVSARTLDAVVVSLHPTRLVAAAVGVINLVVQRAVRALGDTVLLDHVCVKGLALAVARLVTAVLLVVVILAQGVAAADVDVKGPWEELGAHTVLRVVDGALGALSRRSTAWRGGGEGIVGLFVAIGASDDNVEISAVATKVVSGSGLDAGAPERALEVCDRGGLGAIGAGIQAWVALDVEVEGRAKGGVITPCGAVLSTVARQGVQTEI